MNAPPQSVPLYGLPETFVAVHWAAAGGDGVPTPQTLATPARPQISGAVQAPHVRVPPQPFGIVPQFLPCAAQVVGVQAGGGGGGGVPPLPDPEPASAPRGAVKKTTRQAN